MPDDREREYEWEEQQRRAQSPFHNELQDGEPAVTSSHKPQPEQQEAQSKTWERKHDELFRVIKRTLDGIPNHHTNLSKTGVLMNAIRPYLEREREKSAEVATSQLLKENQQLKAVNAELVEMLDEVVERGLIYWEPQTTRGAVARTEMIEKAYALIAKAQPEQSPAREPSAAEPERDRDLEPDL